MKARLEAIVDELFPAADGRINDNTRDTDFDLDDGEDGDGRDRATWSSLEAHVFQELLARDARYCRTPRLGAGAGEGQAAALNGDDPANIAQSLRDARAKLLS